MGLLNKIFGGRREAEAGSLIEVKPEPNPSVEKAEPEPEPAPELPYAPHRHGPQRAVHVPGLRCGEPRLETR